MVQIHTPQPVKMKIPHLGCFLFYMCWVGFEPQKQCGSTAEIRQTAVHQFTPGKNFQVTKQILKIAK